MKTKLKKWLAASAMLAILSLGGIQAQSPFAGGSGTLADPYLIQTVEQLDSVRNHLDAHFALVNDLDMTGIVVWIPIGRRDTIGERFTGSFDGRNHVIRNLVFTGTTAVGAATINSTGLFGFLAPADGGVAVRNLGLENFEITPQLNIAGILAGCLTRGTVFNVFVDNSFMEGTGRNQVGGLVGRVRSGNVLRSWVNVRVNGAAIVGGLVGNLATASGFSPSLIENSYSLGRIFATGSQIGGIAGSANGQTIRNSYTVATVLSGGAAAAGVAGNTATQRAILESNVVLSDTIRSTALATLHRIAASNDAGLVDLRGNFALETTYLHHLSATADSILTVLNGDTLRGRHGQSITLEQASLVETFTTAPFNWNFENTWQIVGATDFPTHRPVPAVASVTIDSEITVGVGLDGILTWTVLPAEADPTVWFKSLDTDIATVANNGEVIGEDIGEVRIVIFAGSIDNPVTDTVTVTIVPSPMDEIRFTVDELVVEHGFTDTLRWVRYPETTPRRVTLESLDTLIATVIVQNDGDRVNARGIVTGVAQGETRIVVHSTSEPIRRDTVDIIVREADVRSVSFTIREIETVYDIPTQLTWTVYPAQAYQGVTFESLDDDIVTVNVEGVITGIGLGEARVVVSAGRAVPLGRDTTLTDTIAITVYEMLIDAGAGTRANPFIITTVEQMNQIRQLLGHHFLLANDLDMTDVEWHPIGVIGAPFTGSFDGGNHIIRNLTINDSAADVALFARVETADSGAIAIQNLGLVDAYIRNRTTAAATRTGALVGWFRYGTILNVFADSTEVRSGGGNTGGLVGQMQTGRLSQSWFSGTVFGTGGLVGSAGRVAVGFGGSIIEDSYMSGSVEGNANIGGVVGVFTWHSILRNVYTTATVRANANTAGGIAAMLTNHATISTSVSLAPSVRADGAAVFRIASGADTVFFNNFALATMQLISGETATTVGRVGLDSVNGYSIPMIAAQMIQTYTTAPFAWDFENIWRMNPNDPRLPVFIWQVEEDDTPSSILNPIPPAASVAVSVSPNPTFGEVSIEIENAEIKQVLIFTMTGQQVFSTTQSEFNIEHLSRGIYVVHIITDVGNFVSRIIRR